MSRISPAFASRFSCLEDLYHSLCLPICIFACTCNALPSCVCITAGRKSAYTKGHEGIGCHLSSAIDARHIVERNSIVSIFFLSSRFIVLVSASFLM